MALSLTPAPVSPTLRRHFFARFPCGYLDPVARFGVFERVFQQNHRKLGYHLPVGHNLPAVSEAHPQLLPRQLR
jgi:hypothetical protein